ncbi:hypothetical protein LCGC14_1348660 [marine sediment metagenome]|uniref:Uncharacterized protein n=1 Tax=marine sediment metagenome TaxID=412755 RepID=A0A0F9KBM2_9ZZZZ
MNWHTYRLTRQIATNRLKLRQMILQDCARKMVASSPADHAQEIEAGLMAEANRAVADAIIMEMVA